MLQVQRKPSINTSKTFFLSIFGGHSQLQSCPLCCPTWWHWFHKWRHHTRTVPASSNITSDMYVVTPTSSHPQKKVLKPAPSTMLRDSHTRQACQGSRHAVGDLIGRMCECRCLCFTTSFHYKADFATMQFSGMQQTYNDTHRSFPCFTLSEIISAALLVKKRHNPLQWLEEFMCNEDFLDSKIGVSTSSEQCIFIEAKNRREHNPQ